MRQWTYRWWIAVLLLVLRGLQIYDNAKINQVDVRDDKLLDVSISHDANTNGRRSGPGSPTALTVVTAREASTPDPPVNSDGEELWDADAEEADQGESEAVELLAPTGHQVEESAAAEGTAAEASGGQSGPRSTEGGSGPHRAGGGGRLAGGSSGGSSGDLFWDEEQEYPGQASGKMTPLREVREVKPDPMSRVQDLRSCHEHAPRVDKGQRLESTLPLVRGWVLPSVAVAANDSYLGFMHKVQQLRTAKREREAKYLPSPVPEWVTGQLSWARCAVVGNSGNLLQEEYGEEIDSNDVVVRINAAPTGQAYQRYIGTATTIRFVNRFWASVYGDVKSLKAKSIRVERGALLLLMNSEPEDAVTLKRALDKMQRSDVQVLSLNAGWVDAVEDLLRSYKICLKYAHKTYGGGAVPSTGLVAVYTLMHLCGQLQAFGFGAAERKQARTDPEDPHQRVYYSGHGADWRGEGKQHTLKAEQALLKALAAEGKILLCGSSGCQSGARVAKGDIDAPP